MYCPKCKGEYPEDWKTCPKDSIALLSTARIGKYQIDGVLGVGGMGSVYRALNPDTGAAVAIKVMNRELTGAPELRERFKREAGVVSRLDTVHVCKVFDFGDDNGTLYLVMELMKGHTLRDEIAPGPGYMDLARVRMVLDGALKGLAAAHGSGVVHRDLKPENVFIHETFDGEVPKLLDFGIARVTSSAETNLTRTGAMMGTASYMAPEQVAGAIDQMGPWTDVYAMGAILYELLAGTAAFGGGTLSEVLHRVIHHDLVPLSTIRGGLPASLYTLVDRCLAAEPRDRPQDAGTMRRELAAIELGTTSVPPPTKTKVDPTPSPSRPAPAPRPVEPELRVERASSKSPVLFIGVGMVVAIGVVVALIASGGGETTTTVPPPGSATIDASVAIIVDVAVEPDAAPDAPPPPAATSCPAGMVLIGSGTFTMGSESSEAMSDEKPAHQVTITGFCIDKTEVTVGSYNTCVKQGGCAEAPKTINSPPTKYSVGVVGLEAARQSGFCHARFGNNRRPIDCIDWDAAKRYCAWAGKRLPTEAEWEYAARGSQNRPYPWGSNKPSEHYGVSNYTDHDVGSFPANATPEGVLDLVGETAEWTADYFGPYPSAAQTDPINSTSSDRGRVIRGQQLTHDGITGDARAALRNADVPSYRYNDLGFRCAQGGAHPDR